MVKNTTRLVLEITGRKNSTVPSINQSQLTTMATAPSPSILRLPKSHPKPSTWRTLIAKQKALRLKSLLTSPESFSSTYEREIAFTDADWEARLRNPSACTLVAVKESSASHGNSTDDDESEAVAETAYLDSEWLGSVVLVGPEEKPEEQHKSAQTTTFDIYALFVLPEARGAGLGSALIRSAASEAQKLVPSATANANVNRTVVIRASVARGNERVLKLYERAGFVERRHGGYESETEAALGAGAEPRVLVMEIGG